MYYNISQLRLGDPQGLPSFFTGGLSRGTDASDAN